MTRHTVDWLANKAMVFVERAGYLLALAPLVIDRLEPGLWPGLRFGLPLDLGLGGAVMAAALLMGYARRQAVRVNSLRKTLNEAIIHDLKNPMAAVMGCLSCALDDSNDIESRHKLLNLGLHSCRSQMNLLDTLVDTSRLEHGELVAQKTALNTRELLDSCLRDVRGVASHLGVSLKETSSGSIPREINGDPDLLPRTLCNLLNNAIKYTPAGGQVSLKTHSNGVGLVFEVNDTGIGIRPEHIDRLFRKYYRVEGADQSGRRGSGLGLYFCRLVIEAHGGKVSIKSRVGQGTTITFNIPVRPGRLQGHDASVPAASQAGARRVEPAKPGHMRQCVMVIDDDNTIRATLRAALEKQYSFIGLSNGTETVDLIKSHDPHLLILDINLPGSEGFDICSEVRSRARLNNLPILFMTVRRDNKRFLSGLGSGGNAVITKPFELSELRGKIDGLLAGRSP